MYSSQNLQQLNFSKCLKQTALTVRFETFSMPPGLKHFKHKGFESVATPALVTSCGELALTDFFNAFFEKKTFAFSFY